MLLLGEKYHSWFIMKKIFERWFNKRGHNSTKCISLYYFEGWDKPKFEIYTNGGKRRDGDKCFDLNIHIGKLAFCYTNWDLQKEWK